MSLRIKDFSPQQLNEIHQAMLDRSEEPVTETFTTYTEIEDSKFNVIWSKISAQACQTKINEPDKNDTKQMT